MEHDAKQLKAVRKVGRACRGLRVIPKMQRLFFFNTIWPELTKSHNFKKAEAAQLDIETYLKGINFPFTRTPLEKDNWDQIQRVLFFSVDIRRGCGYNFNETVESYPFDGEEHKYTCPKCGIKGSFRSPKFGK